jgi:hypothetical protein
MLIFKVSGDHLLLHTNLELCFQGLIELFYIDHFLDWLLE